MFDKESFYQKFNEIKPCLVKTVTTGVQGYIFGAMVGIFTHDKHKSRNKALEIDDFLFNMHEKGLKFAKVGLIYSSTECIVEKVRNKKCPWNSVISGGVTGALMGKKDGVPLLSGISFAAYSGLTEFNKQSE